MSRSMTLEERVRSVLIANGFTEYTPFASGRTPMFDVTEGAAGVRVYLSWEASSENRALMLAKLTNRLEGNGLAVKSWDNYLYVHETTQRGEQP